MCCRHDCFRLGPIALSRQLCRDHTLDLQHWGFDGGLLRRCHRRPHLLAMAFYINLPVGAISLLIMFFFLNVQHRSELSLINRLKRIDFVGNGILIGGTTSMFIVLTYVGSRYPWSSWHARLHFVIFFQLYLYKRDHIFPPAGTNLTFNSGLVRNP